MKSEIRNLNGLPSLFVNGEYTSELAYITYKLEDNCYDDFSKAGFKLFSVCLNFSEMPINEGAPVLVMDKGIFESDLPDFSIVDKNFDLILKNDPDAYIFPRVNVNLSDKWEQAHPDELNDEGYGESNSRRRACFSSDVWAEEIKKNLTLLINYIENSKYKNNVVGYQIAGGNTDEWFPFDHNASYGKRFREKYQEHLKLNNLEDNDENRFSLASDIVAKRIIEFCTLTKELTSYNKITGAFYGYTAYGMSRERCHCSLDIILKSGVVDFLCAPIVYNYLREPGTDLFAPVPVDSLRVNNMIYLSENDIRTHNSAFIHTHPNYTKPIWLGPSKEKSAENIKLGFARAFTHGYGMWWFDMWGGWYKDEEYMLLMKQMTEIMKDGRDEPDNQVALFVDSREFTKVDHQTPFIREFTHNMGMSGISCDTFDKYDFDKVYKNYKLIVFATPIINVTMKGLIEKAEKSGINTFILNRDKMNMTPDEIRDTFRNLGVDIYTDRNAIVHKGKKYVTFYSLDNEETDFSIDGKRTFKDVFSDKIYTFPTKLDEKVCYLFEL